MFPFPQSVNPAVQSHLDSQLAFFNDLSKSLTGSFQYICQANLQLGQTMLEETMLAGQRMLTPGDATDVLGAVTSRAQPASDKLRAYQQHLTRLAADVQVDLARVTRQHVEETSRTAHVLADEVTRAATEATDRSVRQQQEALKSFRDPFQQGSPAPGNGAARSAASQQAARAGMGASMQSGDQADQPSFRGNVQGQAAPQSGTKSPGKPA
jgi:phasin family protein